MPYKNKADKAVWLANNREKEREYGRRHRARYRTEIQESARRALNNLTAEERAIKNARQNALARMKRWERPPVTRTCRQCGNAFERAVGRKGSTHFCSQACIVERAREREGKRERGRQYRPKTNQSRARAHTLRQQEKAALRLIKELGIDLTKEMTQ